MTVWVLEVGAYSDQHILGIFTTRADADLAATIFHDDLCVTEWVVDEQIELMRAGARPYFVRLHRDDGRVLECENSVSTYGVFDASIGEDINRNLHTTVWAMDGLQAVKIASDRRRAFLALPQEVS